LLPPRVPGLGESRAARRPAGRRQGRPPPR
jgi:hypothetical protein